MEVSTGTPHIAALQKHLLSVYAAACAPLTTETLVDDIADLDASDFTVRMVIEELKFLNSFATGGVTTIIEAFDCLPMDSLDQEASSSSSVVASSEVSTAILATAAFATRLAHVATQINKICMAAADRIAVDPTELIKDLEKRSKSGERPSGASAELLRQALDFTPGGKWATVEVPLKNRVGFKETAAVISEGTVKQEALKVAEARRKKQRNPTGYHKFNFKDLGLDSDEFETDGRSRGQSTDGSTRGSVGTAAATTGALTSASSSSIHEDDEQLLLDDDFQKNPFESGEKTASTVFFSSNKEREMIQDKVADPAWEEQQRHKSRFSRIRNRVPTGHPSLMKGPSDELVGIVNQYEKTLSIMQLEDTTTENTEANKSVALVHPGEEKPRARHGSTGSKRTVTLGGEQ